MPSVATTTTAHAVATTHSASHPTYRAMISEAIVTLHERKGSSRHAIKKYIMEAYPQLGDNAAHQIKLAIRKGVEEGYFVQPHGSSGSIKLAKQSHSANGHSTQAHAEHHVAAKVTKKKAGTKKTAKKAAKKAGAKKH